MTKPECVPQCVPSVSLEGVEGTRESSVSRVPLPYGRDTLSEPSTSVSPSVSPNPTCDPCQDYLTNNRHRLLPHLGRTVATTGRPPARIIGDLLTKYHQLGHPDPRQPVVKPEPSEATKALRRIAARRPA